MTVHSIDAAARSYNGQRLCNGTVSVSQSVPPRAYFNVPTGTDVLGDLKSVLEGLLTRA